MSDEQALFAVLGAIYLAECAFWVHRNSVFFCSPLTAGPASGQDESGGFLKKLLGWHLFLPGQTMGNQQGSLVFGNPMPPLGTVFICHPWPVSFSPDGVCSFISQSLTAAGRPSQPSKVSRYEDVQSVGIESHSVMINGQPFVKCRSRRSAVNLAGLIQKLRDMDPGSRAGAIRDAFRKSMDADSVAAAAAAYRKQSLPLLAACNALVMYMFILAPLVIWKYGLLRSVLPFAAFGLALHVTALVVFFITHKRLCPGDGDGRLHGLLTMLLCPPVAARAVDLVSRDVLDGFHPVAAAYFLCRPAVFREFAKKTLLDLRYPIGAGDIPGDMREIEAWHRNMLSGSIEHFLNSRGIGPAGLTRPDIAPDARHKSYCPRCRCAYTHLSGECVDCAGVELVPIQEESHG